VVQPTHILVVDDESDLTQMLQLHLEAEGYDVKTVGSGQAALAALSGSHFDLLLVDIKMPDMNGLDLLRAARQIDRSAAIIVMTAYASVEIVVEALRLGVDDFLVKPFRINFGLLPMVERCLARHARDTRPLRSHRSAEVAS